MRAFLIFLAGTVFFSSASFAAAEPPIRVEVTHVRPGDAPFDLRFWRVRFTNVGDGTYFILAPLDGSTDGLVAPFYRFTLRGVSGEVVRLGRSCGFSGLWANSSWPSTYLIPLPPNHAHEVFIILPIALGQSLPSSGTMDFEYSMPAQPPPTKDRTNPPIDLTYPDDAWRGTLTAKQVTFSANPK